MPWIVNFSYQSKYDICRSVNNVQIIFAKLVLIQITKDYNIQKLLETLC